ncbi:MAG: DUF58 domain-containing protein [Rubripirellula sp.]|nr:DUF58 domain-containing protein [Planctomycetaceae bacterium]MDF1845094.1 DUF58 domain-containing protein [Rubripirellula sp.]
MAVRQHERLIDRFDPKVMSLLLSLDLKARYIVEGFLHGLHKSPFHGISVEFSEYRDYQPGDDLRHLDWQLYARSNRLCVKKYTQETNVRIYLVIDTSGSMNYRGSDAWASKLEVAKAVAAAMTSLALRQNDAVGLLTMDELAQGSDFIRPSQKPSQFGIMLGHLQNIQPAGGPRLAELLQHMLRLIHRRSVILFFSDLLEDADGIRESFQQLRFLGHECLVFQVLDRDELEFPFEQSSVFRDLETQERRTVDPNAARDRYLKRFESFLKEYHDLFQSLEIPHCVLRTDQEPWQALSLFLHERQRLM